VIGAFPCLVAGTEPFVYESCTTVGTDDAWMEGTFEFTTPEQREFHAVVPRFIFPVPPYDT